MAMAFVDLIQHFWISCMIIALLLFAHVCLISLFHCIRVFSRRLVALLEELAFGGFIHLSRLWVCAIHEYSLVNTTYYIPLSIISLFQNVRRH